MDWAKTTAWGYKKYLGFGIWCDLYKRFYVMNELQLYHYALSYVAGSIH